MTKQNNKLNVVHVTFSLDIGGAEIVIFNLIRKFDKQKFNTSICSLTAGGDLVPELENAGIPIHVVQKNEGKDLKIYYRLYRFFRDNNIDIVHCHNMYMLLYCAIPAKLAGAIGVVLTEHANLRNPSKLYCFLSRVSQKFTDLITVNSQQVIDALVNDQGLKPRDMVIIPNGIDFAQYHQQFDTSALRSELGIDADDKVVGIVGRLVPVKDHLTLIKAFAKLVARLPSARLLIVGDGQELDNLKAFVEQQQLNERVIFTGFRRDILALLNVMHAFVLSSLKEGQSISILEAMAVGLPVVATAVGGTPELVMDNETGLLVPSQDPEALGNAIYKVLSDSETAARLGDAGRKRIQERYDLEKITRDYEEYYAKF